MPLSREELVKIQAELEAEIRKIKPVSWGGGVSRPEYLDFGTVIFTIRKFFDSEPSKLTIAQIKAMIERKIKECQCTIDDDGNDNFSYAVTEVKNELSNLLKEINEVERDAIPK